jgi:hypothetical protein
MDDLLKNVSCVIHLFLVCRRCERGPQRLERGVISSHLDADTFHRQHTKHMTYGVGLASGDVSTFQVARTERGLSDIRNLKRSNQD